MSIVKYIPSHVVVAGYRALISYEGQPTNCYSFKEPGHLQTAYPHRRREPAKRRPTTTASWAEVATRGPISNTAPIVDRVTDMAAPENMEAETLQAADSAPTPQKEEIGERGVEGAPTMEEERVLEHTDTAVERQHVEGRRRKLSNDHASSSWGAGGQDEDTSRAAISEAAARQRGDWTNQQRQHEHGMGTQEWNTGGKEGSLAPSGRYAKDSYGDHSQKTPKIEDRQTGRHSWGDGGVHRGLRESLPFKNEASPTPVMLSMSEVYKIATLNINGMATPPRIAMLEYFLQK